MNAAATRSRPVRVVIVDDTLDLRELLGLALTRGGMEVVGEAGDGLAGIDVVRAERPDVVLLDLSMPVMDGLEALPRIRRLVPDAKIIVLSGFGATQMSERALATGADGYLQKGISLKRILEYVRSIVDGPPDPSGLPIRPTRSAWRRTACWRWRTSRCSASSRPTRRPSGCSGTRPVPGSPPAASHPCSPTWSRSTGSTARRRSSWTSST